MIKIVIAGRNDAGKSTLVAEIYKGLKGKEYQPLIVGSGIQDEKPLLQKGIDPQYIVIAAPLTGRDINNDLDKVIRIGVGKIEEKNSLILHARKALDELNKVRSVLELGMLSQDDLPLPIRLPDITVIETVGVSDGYKAPEGRKAGDILVSVVPAGIKTELLMEKGQILLEEADILVVTKIDETARSIATSNIKLLQRIYNHKAIIPVVATQGVHIDLVIDEIIRMVRNLPSRELKINVPK